MDCIEHEVPRSQTRLSYFYSLTHSLTHTSGVEPSLLLSACQQEEPFLSEFILISQALGLFWM